MDWLVKSITQFIHAQGLSRNYYLAYSGGLDSAVLLHVLTTVRTLHPFPLRAIHVNHGMSKQADRWAAHCQKCCLDYQIPLIQKKLEVLPLSNYEAELREQRYQHFQNTLEKNDILLTAHHQNDQAETILLQLCRGAGPKGLAAMPRIKPFGQGFHARPLLDFTRDELAHYANHHQLNWVEDESNANSELTRNFLRQEVIPLLKKRWPGITKTLARAAENCADAQQFIDATTKSFEEKMQGSLPGTLSVKQLLLHHPTEQRHVLRAWMKQKNFLLPSAVKMQQMRQTILLARMDKMPHVKWGNAEIRRYRDDLFLMKPLLEHDAKQIIPWDLSQPMERLSTGTLHASLTEGQGLRATIKQVTIQFRKGGERVRLSGRSHHYELKKAFQMWGVLPWLRDRIPLLYVDDVLVCVAGLWMNDEFLAGQDELGWNIYYSHCD